MVDMVVDENNVKKTNEISAKFKIVSTCGKPDVTKTIPLLT